MPLIAASCILVCCRFNEAHHIVPLITKIFNEHIKVNDQQITIDWSDMEMIAADMLYRKEKLEKYKLQKKKDTEKIE